MELLLWQPERVNFTTLEHCGGWSARTHARWFARDFPFAHLAVAALGAAQPQPVGELLALDASFVPKSGDETWGLGWFWSGMARAARRGLEVSLLAAVDTEEGGAYPLCARQSPGATPSRRQTCGAATGRETTVDAGLALLREALDAGAGEILKVRWVAADGGYSTKTFVEGVRKLGLHTVGRLRKDKVRFPYTGPHARRPGRSGSSTAASTAATRGAWPARPCLYHAQLHSKAWQRWLRVVYVLPRGADPQTKEGMLLYSTDLELSPARLWRLYRARFQIEFAFRDAKQHLGLNDCQARSQARLHFHFHGLRGPLLGPPAGAAPGGGCPGPLFPAQSQAPQSRGGNPQKNWRRVGPGSKRLQFQGRPPPHPPGTPLATGAP